MTCPLCQTRRARRACPALGQDICPVCCGTKRLVEIRCPSDCGYLATAREHPPAVSVRQQQSDIRTVLPALRDLSERQTRLFFFIASEMARHQPDGLHALIDADLQDAAGSLAATYETAARGVIYEHRPTGLAAQRLATALGARLEEVGAGIAGFDRDAAIVLRRFENAARPDQSGSRTSPRALLDLLGRVTSAGSGTGSVAQARPPEDEPRLIVP